MMVTLQLVGLAIASLSLGSAQAVEVASEERWGCPLKGGAEGSDEKPGPGFPQCQFCKGGTPKSFPFAPCPVDTRLKGSVSLGGDVEWGRMNIQIEGALSNNCGGSEPCQKALLDVSNLYVRDVMYKEHGTVVTTRNPEVSPGCAVCDVDVSYGKKPDPHPPQPPKDVCDVKADLVALIDVSKSMKHPKDNPDNTIKLVQNVSRRFNIGKDRTRFAVTAFADIAMKEWGLKSKVATDGKKVRQGLAQIDFTNKFSNHGAALDSAIDQLKADGSRKSSNIVLLFADGKPNKDIRRLENAVKRLRCMPQTCFAIVGINVKSGSEEDAFFRYLLSCPAKGKCKELFLANPNKTGEIKEVAEELTEFVCKCAKSPKVPRPDAVTTFTVRIDDTTLPDFGTRDELNRTVDEMLYNVAEATGITPDRLTAIAIEDTVGNTVGEYDQMHQAALPSGDGPSATMVEVMFEEPGLNAEPASQETVRRLATLFQDKESTLAERLQERGLSGARIERMAIRKNEGSMPIVDVLQV